MHESICIFLLHKGCPAYNSFSAYGRYSVAFVCFCFFYYQDLSTIHFQYFFVLAKLMPFDFHLIRTPTLRSLLLIACFYSKHCSSLGTTSCLIFSNCFVGSQT